MKPNNESLEPTKSELEILQVLWKHGSGTVRFVNDQLNAEKREVQYASTLKLMQIMVDKGLLKRDESQVKHIYSAVVEENKAKRFLLGRFLDSMFDGSASSLMTHLLEDESTSEEELKAIRQLLNNHKKTK